MGELARNPSPCFRAMPYPLPLSGRARYESGTIMGIFARLKTPPAIITRLTRRSCG